MSLIPESMCVVALDHVLFFQNEGRDTCNPGFESRGPSMHLLHVELPSAAISLASIVAMVLEF